MINSGYEKGEIVCLLILSGSNAYRAVANKPIECRFKRGVVTAVGRKYITVNDGCYDYKFDVKGDHTQQVDAGSIDYKLFHKREDAEEYLSAKEVFAYIRKCFDPAHDGDYSLDQLIRIGKILKEGREAE